MSDDIAKIRATIVVFLKNALLDAPVVYGDLLERSGIRAEDLDDPLSFIPLDSVVALFDETAKALEDPGFGINISAKIQPGGAGLLSQLALHAPNVQTALECAAKFTSVYMTQVDSSFRMKDGVGYLSWQLPPSIVRPRIHYNIYMASLIVRRLRGAVGGDWLPLSVSFDHRAPDCDELTRSVFGERVAFDQPETVLAVDAQCLASEMPNSDPVLFAMFYEYAVSLIRAAKEKPGIVVATRNEIASLLGKHEANLETVAKRMGLTPRALQWRLSQVDTTFEVVLSSVRESLARHLLQDTDRPLSEIAYDLGYAEPSVFTRAAKRWFDVSPREFRKQMRDKF